ncbi:glyoxalase/bleomycin resistance/dioxygenase family protein [Arthrobacter sp. HMWF013]|uniref:glyoxalase/bleomycin resistance/dioxygenase family protein n=1 Tax=Arthrobacter sp. HMWF013 TaxID=2056849 RepID=UPI000D36F358|nr:glyoxalase/bleomycin resistance/dioxygenase family protein [Arthrobacter sp. HMWF013]PTT69827.1 glyoxalase/bleomycin resistance/dioxygenase family protein [Arthrobacter sp. HMWF013]
MSTETDQAFRVKSVFHPTLHVPSLDAAEDFFSRVFGRPSTNIGTVMKTPPAPGHSTDYSNYTLIADVLIDSLEPSRYFTGGVQRYPDIDTGQLNAVGWYVDGAKDLYQAFRSAGVRLVDARDRTLDTEEWSGGPSPFYSLPEDAGMRYQFFETFPFPLDPRADAGWTAAALHDGGPLGIVRTSHHTILTTRPDRALKVAVDLLGGEIVHSGADSVRGISGAYVHLADAVFHFATPEAGTPAAADHALNGPFDTYHAITWEVEDLDTAAKHLAATGVGIAAHSATSLVTDPATSLGVPWGFTTEPAQHRTP